MIDIIFVQAFTGPYTIQITFRFDQSGIGVFGQPHISFQDRGLRQQIQDPLFYGSPVRCGFYAEISPLGEQSPISKNVRSEEIKYFKIIPGDGNVAQPEHSADRIFKIELDPGFRFMMME